MSLAACSGPSGTQAHREPQYLSPKTRAARLKSTFEQSAREGEARIRVDRLNHFEYPRRDVSPSELPPYQPLHTAGPDFDAIHYRISLDFPASSLQHPNFNGEVQLTFRPIHANTQTLALDSQGLEIQEVQLLNTFQAVPFETRDEQLTIDLGRAYQPTDTLTVSVKYHWAKNPNDGVFFRSRTGVKEIEAIYSQSEPELSKAWFPGNSRPNDRATFESIIRVPEPFVAVSNGALLSMTDEGASRVYHWSQRMPMVSYLFVVTAGRFGVHSEKWEHLNVDYYGPTDDLERVSYSLRNTPKMLTFLSEKVGLRYPFEKYAQTVVPQYMWGGMEHTTATTLTDKTVHGVKEDDQFSSDSLVAHELAHQWFGDLVTCKSWDHLWLNEGFASYFDALYQEHSRGRSALLETMSGVSNWYFWQEGQDARPVVFPYYRYSADDFFDGHAYAKGAWVLHMLRDRLGDVVFFQGVRHYLHRHQGMLVETQDFQRAMEEISGQDLTSFFDQWLMKPGYPVFETSWTYDEAKKEVALKVIQAQDRKLPGGIAGETPHFTGPIGVEVAGTRHRIQLTDAETYRIPAPQAPGYVKFNSDNAWLAQVSMDQSQEAWTAQLQTSSDPTARIEAAQNLGGFGDSRTLAALKHCAEKDSDTWVRSRCVSQLGMFAGEPETDVAAVFATLKHLAQDSNWKIREATLRAAASLHQDSTSNVLDWIRGILKTETKVRVLAEAVRTLGSIQTPETFDLLINQLKRESFQDKLQEATFEALGALKDLRALPIAEEYVGERHSDSIRLGAFNLLVELGVEYPEDASERARLAIEAQLQSPSYNARKSAVTALGMLKNPRALEALKRVAETDPDARIQTRARESIRRLTSTND